MLDLRQTFIEEIDRNPLQPVCQSYESVIIDQNKSQDKQTFLKSSQIYTDIKNHDYFKFPAAIDRLP